MKKILLLLVVFCLALPTVQSKTLKNPLDGDILVAPLTKTETSLINEDHETIKTWESNYRPGLSACWLPDGSIYRGYCIQFGVFGGGVQKIDSNNNVVWDFYYWNESVKAHHDITPLPNGNILMIAWETKTRNEAIEQGRNPNNVQNEFLPDKVIEVKPTGPTTGDIVWEWHVWDHLIQDFDPYKQNYGVVSEHPELVDINIGGTGDWLHTNSIDYNPQFDQILLSIRNFNEIWIIDHSTTTEEAAGHTGGNSGKGGDLLYRWGNPIAYDRGSSNDQMFSLQHCARWVKQGRPGAGNILVFNNGVLWLKSFVDEITPPISPNGNYNISGNQPYGPLSVTWSYSAPGFYSGHLSGAERLPNGNTLILDSEASHYFVVTPTGNIVWEYSTTGEPFSPCFIPDYTPTNPDLDTEGILHWTSIKPGDTVTGVFQVRNIGTGRVNWTINNTITWGFWNITPMSGYNYDNITTVTVTVEAPDELNSDFEGYIRVQNTDNESDFELVLVTLSTPVSSFQSMKNFYLSMKNLRGIANKVMMFFAVFRGDILQTHTWLTPGTYEAKVKTTDGYNMVTPALGRFVYS